MEQIPGATLDKEIVEAVWLTYEEILLRRSEMRSPLVLSDIERFRAGISYPLELLANFNIHKT